jgi:23S rRNA (uracil1939-C5)-methyltransferase
MAIGDICKIQLESIVAGGDAIGRMDGMTVFVEGGAPDEAVLCRVLEEHKNRARAELLEIIEASPVRVTGSCGFYGKCGGCNLQHIEYNSQIEIKTEILKETILKIGGLSPAQIEVFSSPPFEYRNRMQFHCFREKAAADQKFGLKGRRSGEIIAVSDCPVADSGIREVLKEGVKTLPLPVEKDRFNVFSFKGFFLSEGGTESGKIKFLDKEILLDAGVFFQSNLAMLEKLILELQKTAAASERTLPMADLYCGVGTFAVFLNDLFPKTVLAEENRKAVSLARENLKGKNVEFFALRDNEWERTLTRGRMKFGFAVADPPRKGLNHSLAAALAKEGPPVLAYVSCDAPALARDSKILTDGGYELKELKLFDFYPQTAHIESLAVFVR